MQSDSNIKPGLINASFLLISLAITVAILILARTFLIPIAWGLVIALASFHLLNTIERKYKLKRLTSSLMFVLILLITLIVLFSFFFREISSIIHTIPSFGTQLIDTIQGTISQLGQLGLPVPSIDKAEVYTLINEHSDALRDILSSLGKGISSIILTCVYLFFMLYYRDNFLYFLKLRYKTNEGFSRANKEVREVVGVISNFLQGLMSMTFILTVILYIIFLLVGLNFALFFAVLVALLALIPYIGNPLGMGIVLIYALLTNEGWIIPLLVLAGMILTNMFKSYVIKPVIIGNKINLNAFMIFISVILGGLIWGISGMILFMPFAGILNIIFESNESTKPFTAFFTVVPKDAFIKKV